MCPDAVAWARIASREAPRSRGPFPKLLLTTGHTLSLPPFRLSGMREGNLKMPKNTRRLSRDARRKFKDAREHSEAFPGCFSCPVPVSCFLFPGWKRRGQVGRSTFTH